MSFDSLAKSKARLAAKMIRVREYKRAPDASVELIRHWPQTGQRRGVIAGYVPIHDEIDPRPLMQALADAGHALCLPRTPRKGQPLTLHNYTIGNPLERGPYGTRQPARFAPIAAPDIMLVPLLAYSRTGFRLGYGGGFYDRTLAALRAERKIFACGLAFSGQEVPTLPTDMYDQRLDGVLTELGFKAFI